MDPRLSGQYSPTVAMRAAILAMKCLLKEQKHRPSADEVVKALEQLQELQKAADSSRREPVRKQGDLYIGSFPSIARFGLLLTQKHFISKTKRSLPP